MTRQPLTRLIPLYTFLDFIGVPLLPLFTDSLFLQYHLLSLTIDGRQCIAQT